MIVCTGYHYLLERTFLTRVHLCFYLYSLFVSVAYVFSQVFDCGANDGRHAFSGNLGLKDILLHFVDDGG